MSRTPSIGGTKWIGLEGVVGGHLQRIAAGPEALAGGAYQPVVVALGRPLLRAFRISAMPPTS